MLILSEAFLDAVDNELFEVVILNGSPCIWNLCYIIESREKVYWEQNVFHFFYNFCLKHFSLQY
jgi:hypothetical protein